jgi:transposase
MPAMGGDSSEDYQQQIVELREQLRRAHLVNKLLQEKVDQLVRKVFGRSAEQIDTRQLTLLPEGSSALVSCVSKPAESKNKPRSKRPVLVHWPEQLPVKEEVLEPEVVSRSPQDWRLIGTEVSEQLDYQPGHFFRRRLIRRKYVSRRQPAQAPVIAPLPPCLQERCQAAPGLLAHIIAGKYAAHLPIYRQQQLYRQQHGVTLSRQTMADWLRLAAGGCNRFTN